MGVILSEAKDLRGSVSDRRTSGDPSLPLRAIALRATALGDKKRPFANAQGDKKRGPQGDRREALRAVALRASAKGDIKGEILRFAQNWRGKKGFFEQPL